MECFVWRRCCCGSWPKLLDHEASRPVSWTRDLSCEWHIAGLPLVLRWIVNVVAQLACAWLLNMSTSILGWPDVPRGHHKYWCILSVSPWKEVCAPAFVGILCWCASARSVSVSVSSCVLFSLIKTYLCSECNDIQVIVDVQVSYGDNVIIQKYVHNPLLLDGYKFDLRLYILVTSFHPLEAFIYQASMGTTCIPFPNRNTSTLPSNGAMITFMAGQRFSSYSDGLCEHLQFIWIRMIVVDAAILFWIRHKCQCCAVELVV